MTYVSEIREIVSFCSLRLLLRTGKTFTAFIITYSVYAVSFDWPEMLMFSWFSFLIYTVVKINKFFYKKKLWILNNFKTKIFSMKIIEFILI